MRLSLSSGGSPDAVRDEVAKQAAQAAKDQPAEVARAIAGISNSINQLVKDTGAALSASVVAHVNVQFIPAPVTEGDAVAAEG